MSLTLAFLKACLADLVLSFYFITYVLFFSLFSSDRSNSNTTPLSSSGSLKLHRSRWKVPDVEYSEVSHPGNESSVDATSAAPEQTSTLELKDMNVTSDSNSTSDPGVLQWFIMVVFPRIPRRRCLVFQCNHKLFPIQEILVLHHPILWASIFP